jgi:hypothetical protein
LSHIHRSTCFGHCCAHHQEPPPTAFTASGYRMIVRLDVLQADHSLKHVHTPLNMFRALLCPSSGAPSNCLYTFWLPYDCQVGRASSRPQLEARPTQQSYGNRKLQRQLEGAPDDGHYSARNMLSFVYARKQ